MHGIFDIALDCEIPLPELALADKPRQTIVVKRASSPCFAGYPVEWFHDWPDVDGGIAISGGRVEDNYVLRFPGQVDFLISINERAITCFHAAGVPEETIRHLLLDQAVPRMLGQMGELIVHASAICLPEGAGIAFLGNSGWGKSTLTASYLDSEASFITDDCLLLNISDAGVYGIANYYGARLFEDSARALFSEPYFTSGVAHYTDKKRISLFHLPRAAKQKVPLAALFVLNDPTQADNETDVSITPLIGAAGLMSIIKQTFFIDVTDKKTYAGQFETLGKIVGLDTKMYNLSYPRRHESLPLVRQAIKQTLYPVISS
jgi:hypothetical protein